MDRKIVKEHLLEEYLIQKTLKELMANIENLPVVPRLKQD